MTRCAVLLRGVNVGRSNRIAMADLRALLERLGGRDVVTHLQSGNAVLDWDGPPLGPLVEAALRDDLGLDVAVLVRDDLDAVVAGCPVEVTDPKQVHVVFLSGPPDALEVPDTGEDRVLPGPDCLYVAYAGPSHSSPVARWLASSRFPLVASARNWRTVLALRDLLRG